VFIVKRFCGFDRSTPRKPVTRFYAGVASPRFYAGVTKGAVSMSTFGQMPVIFVYV